MSPVLLLTILQCLAKSDEYERQYQLLWSSVEDRLGLEAIRSLHQQLDDDNDGTIEPSETGDFIKADLQVGIINILTDIKANWMHVAVFNHASKWIQLCQDMRDILTGMPFISILLMADQLACYIRESRIIPGQGLKIINLQNLRQIWDDRDCNNEHCMSRNVIKSSLDTIPITRQFFLHWIILQ